VSGRSRGSPGGVAELADVEEGFAEGFGEGFAAGVVTVPLPYSTEMR
jgi:hypothetical protein